MALRAQIANLLRNLFHKSGVECELDEEIRAHLNLLTDEKMKAGMAPAQARRAARIELGGVEQVKEEVRGVRMGTWPETIAQDVRYGARMLRRKPGFTAVAILTLAVGIGANTAIFSVVNAVLLQPLPYPASDRLAIVWTVLGNEGRAPESGLELIYLRERSHLFQELAGIWATSGALTAEGEPEQVRVGQVTGNFLPLLSRHPALGRFFLPEEEHARAARVVILADGLWRRRFGANPQIVGRSVLLSGQSYTVVGVMPADFKLIFPEDANVPPDIQIYIPFPYDLAKLPPDLGFIRVIGRLRPGATFPQAQKEADAIAAHLRSEFTEFAEENLGLRVFPLHGDDVRNVRRALLLLFGGVGLVLLIACANVANLLLSRANERHKEITLRSALGAAPSRIVRQLLTESILLSSLGGTVALGVGWSALRWLLSLRPEGVARVGSIGLSLPVLGFTTALSLAAGILFGLAPALDATGMNLVESLKESGRSTALRKQRARSLLVVCEVALGFVVLVGAGLMVRTFVELVQVNPGFQADRVLTFQLSLPGVRYPNTDASVRFLRALQKNLSAMPGVESVGAISHLPLDDELPNWYSGYWPEGATKEEQNTVMADHCSVLPGFFRSVGATMIAGRDFDEFDDVAHRHVVIVDDTLARETWPNANPLGKKLNIETMIEGNFARDWAEVVGVVRHVQYHSLTKNVRAQVYVPFPLAPRGQMGMGFTVRTTAAPQLLVGSIREEVAKLDKDLPVSKMRPMEEYVQKARTETQFTTMLASGLAGIALLLACIGIYGVTTFAVAQRTSEIGIRIALGAQRRDILSLVLREGLLPVASGVLIGLALSFVLTPLFSNLLFGVRPTDPATFATGAAFLFAVGLLACYIPARRAMQVDPMVALRYE